MINIQTLVPDNAIVHRQSFAQQYVDYSTKFSGIDAVNYSTEPGKILAVWYTELASHEHISWHPVNIIFAKTVQQIYDFRHRLDPDCSYIFVTESWCDLDSMREFFEPTILDHCCVLNEVMDYGREWFQFDSHLAVIETDCTVTPSYDFFCLIGRRSWLRSMMISELLSLDLSHSLVKYHGTVLTACDAANFDSFNYDQHNFYSDYHRVPTGLTRLSKLVQASLYHNFRFEVQVETDPYGDHMGWDLHEFHVTEKSLRPLIMNKPCLMLGPRGYHGWLAQHGIDLGQRNFDWTAFDSIADERDRMIAMIKVLADVDFSSVKPSHEEYVNNLAGLHSLANLSKASARRFDRLIRDHG